MSNKFSFVSEWHHVVTLNHKIKINKDVLQIFSAVSNVQSANSKTWQADAYTVWCNKN